MTGLSSLVVPILLSSVIVFIASAIIHMAPLWHRNDFPAVLLEFVLHPLEELRVHAAGERLPERATRDHEPEHRAAERAHE